MQHVFIIGSKGIPANYGGYETFVEKLTENQVSPDIKYHVACAVDSAEQVGEFEHNGAHCFNVLAQARRCREGDLLRHRRHQVVHRLHQGESSPAPHRLRAGLSHRPFFGRYVNKIHALGGKVLVNPDGHEWMRAKWSAPVRKYWKVSERGMVKHADLMVCDSKNIEKYIRGEYADLDPETTFIAYGADIKRSLLADDDPKFTGWLSEKGLEPFGYYLVVGRFVPENNYETMIREFMASDSKRDFALVTGVDDSFLAELERKTHFKSDPRIKFVGTVYDQELLKKIREQAYGYFHGHEVGGTNPSLLEALASTRLNLLLDVGFNREVAEDSALYWGKKSGDLAELINRADAMDLKSIEEFDAASTSVIRDRYSWRSITDSYENLFLGRQ